MLNFAIVGCGRIAQRHSELLGTGQVNNARLVAVCDIDLAKANALSKKFDVPAYIDMHEMMQKQPNIDVVVVLTPSGDHADHVVALSPYKKHIVVEKPMALTIADADRMIDSAKKNDVKLFVVKQNRYNVPVKKMRDQLENGRFGNPIMGTIRVRWCRDQKYYDQDTWRGTWKMDGGVFTNQASHHVDLLQWMMGDVESVFAKTNTYLVNTETEDTGIALLKFKSGALGVIEATTAVRPKDLEGSITVLGSTGTVEIAGFAVNEIRHWNFSQPTEEDKDVMQKFSVNPPNVYGFGHMAYYQHVVDCLVNNKTPDVSGDEGKKSLQLIQAIYESVEQKKEIVFPFEPKMSKLGKL
jgi:predicted dehydrogenase